MKTIEQAREMIKRELSKQLEGSMEEGVYKKALELAEGNKCTGFLLSAIDHNVEVLETAYLLDVRLRKDAIALYRAIAREIREIEEKKLSSRVL